MNKWISFLLFFCLLISVSVPPVSEAQTAMDRGLAAAKQKEWELAIKYFSEAQKAAPTSPRALFNLALANDKHGGRELLALAWYHAYLAAAPDANNAAQISTRLTQLEIKVEANVGKLITRAQKAARSMDDYLLNSDAALRTEVAKSSIEFARRLTGKEGEKKMIAELRQHYRDKHGAEPYLAIAEAQAKIEDFADAKTTATQMRKRGVSGRVRAMYAIRTIAKEQAKRGKIAAALETAKVDLVSDKIKMREYNEALTDIATAQINAGDLAGATRTADMIPEWGYQAGAYRSIAKAYAAAGDEKTAKASLASSLSAAARESDSSSAIVNKVYVDVAGTYVDLGEIADALEAVAKVADDSIYKHHKPGVYSKILSAQLKARDFTSARKTAKLAGSRYDVYYIAMAHIKAGDLAAAQETAELIPDDARRETKARVLGAIVEAYIAQGELPRAQETVELIPDDGSSKPHALGAIAGAYIEKGNLAQANKILAVIKDDYYRSSVFAKFAEAQLEQGNLSAAASSVRKMKDGNDKSRLYLKIVEAYVEQGKLADAEKTAQIITKDTHKSDAFGAIAEGHAKAGDIKSARRTAALTGSKSDEFDTLEDAARAVLRKNQLGLAREILASAIQVAGDIGTHGDRAYKLGRAAEYQIDAGDPEGARATAAQALRALKAVDQKNDEEWDPAAYGVASSFNKIGEIDSALAIAAQITSGYYKASAYCRIAVAQAKAGHSNDADKSFATALAAASMMKKAYSKPGIFDSIATALAGTGRKQNAAKAFAAALAAASDREHVSLRVGSYTSIARSQFKVGEREAARKTVALAVKTCAEIERQSDRDYYLGLISRTLVDAGEPALTPAVIQSVGAMVDMRAKEEEQMAKKEEQRKKAVKRFTARAENIRSEPALTNTQTYLASLSGKKPHEVVLAIAETARDMADMLGQLRTKL